MPTHDFREGETVYDVDGNSYQVRSGRAVLQIDGTRVSYFLGRTTAKYFYRENPKAAQA